MEWQPIETAPRASRAILVYCQERKNTYVVCHSETRGWQHFGGDGDLIEFPTHWMPLPEPPKE